MRIEDFDEYGRPVYLVDISGIELMWAQSVEEREWPSSALSIRVTPLADGYQGVGYTPPELLFTSYADAERYAALVALGR